MRLGGINRLTQLPHNLMLFQVVLPKESSKGKAETFALSCILVCPDKLGDVNQKNGRVVGDHIHPATVAILQGSTKTQRAPLPLQQRKLRHYDADEAGKVCQAPRHDTKKCLYG